MEAHCLLAVKIVHHHANGRFDWLISGHQSVNPSREAISILSGKYKRFTFVFPECQLWIIKPGLHIVVRLQLHGAVYRPDSFVLMLCYCGNLKAIRYESTSLN